MACWDIYSAEETEIPKFRIKEMLIFPDSQRVVHKEFAPEGKAVNAEFYKE